MTLAPVSSLIGLSGARRLRPMNIQERTKMVHEVIGHLREQGERSLMPDPDAPGEMMCAYRSPCGNKCAAGFLIPDEMYSEDMENLNVVFLHVDVLESMGCNDPVTLRALRILQDLHDKAEHWGPCGIKDDAVEGYLDALIGQDFILPSNPQ